MIKLCAVQFTPEFGKIEKNLVRIEALLENVDADIFVLPELCTTGYFFQSREAVARVAEPADGETAGFFKKLSRRHDAMIFAGFAERDGDRYYNSCLIATPQESEVRTYRKTHLFYKERLCFEPGDTGFFVIDDPERDVRVGPMVCYDWRFPESARILALLGADVIVCPANLVTEAWRQVMPARAIENQVYLAVANRAGKETQQGETLAFKGCSAIYGVQGEVRQQAGSDGDDILIAEIDPQNTRDKSFNPFNDVFQDRRPQYYNRLIEQ